jgi:hypothetical protein
MGLRSWVKRLERTSHEDMVEIGQADGSTARFYEGEIVECFLHEHERGGRNFHGEEPGPAHPFVEALRGAAPGEVERLVPDHGTILLHLLGEDEIIRGERERPGPPVRETSPGVYE